MKFHRQRDQRQALIKSLADSLILNESIQTTLPKAKVVVSYTERLITKAKKGGLHNRRQVIKALTTKEAAHKLVDEISPKLNSRNSGYFRVTKGEIRRGDAAQLANVAFVDKLAEIKATKKAEAVKKVPVEPKAAPLKPEAKVQTEKTILSHVPKIKEPPKRSGRRGNR